MSQFYGSNHFKIIKESEEGLALLAAAKFMMDMDTMHQWNNKIYNAQPHQLCSMDMSGSHIITAYLLLLLLSFFFSGGGSELKSFFFCHKLKNLQLLLVNFSSWLTSYVAQTLQNIWRTRVQYWHPCQKTLNHSLWTLLAHFLTLFSK